MPLPKTGASVVADPESHGSLETADRDPNGSAGEPTVESLARGQAAQHFFEEHSRRLYAYCLRQLGSREEAEDALQATYLNAWRSLRRGFNPETPRSWLFAIAHNVCLTSLRACRRQRAIEHCDPDELDAVATGREYNGDDLIGLTAALAALPERQRHALLLRDWRGCSYEEIASEMQLSHSAVETLIFRARRAVAAALEAPATPPRRRLTRSLLASLFGPAIDGVRSALASNAHAKRALAVALGATAPLVTFGLVEGRLERVDAPEREAAASPIVRRSSARAPVGAPVPAVEEVLRRAQSTTRSEHAAPLRQRHDSTAPPMEQPAGPTTPEPHKQPSSAPTSGEKEPKPESESPPASPGQENEKVTVCQQTGSKKNPYVTITVSEDAVPAHLEHGDTLGACPG